MLRSLHVLSFYQPLNPLLDDKWTWLEPLVELLDNFCHQLVMVQLFPTLHNPDNTSLYLMFPVLVNFLPCLISFWLSFPLSSTGLLNFHPVEGRCEGFIYREY